MGKWKVTLSRIIEQRTELIITEENAEKALDRAIEYAEQSPGLGWKEKAVLIGPSPAVVPIIFLGNEGF